MVDYERAVGRAKDYIKELSAGDKKYENDLLRGMLILLDALNGEL